MNAAVVIPTYLYDNIERSRERLMELIEKAQARNKDVPSEVIEADIAEAIRAVRAEQAKRQKR